MALKQAKKFSFELELNQSLTPAQKDAVADSIQRLFCSYLPETEVDLKGGKITVSVTEVDKFTRLKFEDAKNKLKWNRQVDLLNEKSAAKERRCVGCGTDLGVIKPTTNRVYRVSGPKDSPKVETLGPYNGNRVPKDHLVSGKGSYYCPTCASDKGFTGNGGPDLTIKHSRTAGAECLHCGHPIDFQYNSAMGSGDQSGHWVHTDDNGALGDHEAHPMNLPKNSSNQSGGSIDKNAFNQSRGIYRTWETVKNSSNQSHGSWEDKILHAVFGEKTAYQPFCLDCGSFDVTPAGDAGFKCNVCGEKWVNPGFNEQDVEDFAFDLEDADDDVNLEEGDDRERGLLGKSAGKPSDWECPYCRSSSDHDHKPNCPVTQSLNSIDGTGAPKQATNYPLRPSQLEDEEAELADDANGENHFSSAHFDTPATLVQHFLLEGSVIKFSEGEDCPVCGLSALAADGTGNVCCGGCGLSLPDPNPVDADFAESPSCPYCGSDNCAEDDEYGGHNCFDCGENFEPESSFLA